MLGVQQWIADVVAPHYSIPSFYFKPRDQRKRTEAQKTQKHTVKQSRHKKTYIHIYTTRSDFTKALLLALQRAASDFLALIIKVSKLGKPVKGSILVTL